MLPWLQEFLARYPELALFLVISIGYYIGSFKIAGIGLGPVTGSLFAGILIGQIGHVPVSGMTKSFLFLLFLFGIGYSVGPQFVQSLKHNGIKPVILSIVVACTGLATAIVVAKMLHLDPGFAAGLVSGALTESPAMGTATEAINALPLPEQDRAVLIAHVAVADAVCYVFGAVGVILFCGVIAPALLRVDLGEEALKLEKELGITRRKAGIASAWRKFEMRAYRVPEDAAIVGRTVAEAEASQRDVRFFIHRVRRGDEVLEATPGLLIQAFDVVAISGPRGALIEIPGAHAEEIEDRELLDIPVSLADIIIISRELGGRSLAEAAQEHWTRGLYLRSLKRGGVEIPIAPGFVVERGDVLTVVGPEDVVQRVAKKIGAIVAPTTSTDFVVLGLAIFLGGLAGVLVTFPIGDMKISLSTSVGTLLAGLVVGHLRTRFPLFGRIPDGAVALMTSLGLAAFVGMTGLHAGPLFLSSIAQAGLGLLVGGAVVTLTPMIVGLVVGRFILGMNPVLMLGALAGAQTMTAAMAAVQERSGSPVAVLGYTPAVPFGHILLTTWGTVIVSVIAG
jgi:putative transport protein